MEMFEATSDVSDLAAADVIARDAKEYAAASGDTICIAQIETVGKALKERTDELLEALDKGRGEHGYALYALMVTDIVEKGTNLLVAGHLGPVERAFGTEARSGVVALPGVMSRKKQVAPKLLAAL